MKKYRTKRNAGKKKNEEERKKCLEKESQRSRFENKQILKTEFIK